MPTHHNSWFTSPGLITTDRWIGLAVALAGVIIVSDGAAIRQAAAASRNIHQGAGRRWTQTKALIAKLRGGKRHELEATSVLLTGSSGRMRATGSATAHISWDATSSSTAKIEALHSHVTALQHQVEAAQQRIVNTERAVEQNHTETTGRVETLERRVDDADQRDRRINERGLIPTAMGLLLTAAPDDALSLWGHPLPALILPAAGTWSVGRATWLAIRERPAALEPLTA